MHTYRVFYGMLEVTVDSTDPFRAAEKALPLLRKKFESEIVYSGAYLYPKDTTELRVRLVKDSKNNT